MRISNLMFNLLVNVIGLLKMQMCSKKMNFIVIFLMSSIVITQAKAGNRYSEEENKMDRAEKVARGGKLTHNQAIDKPFRTNKLNIMWAKALMKFDREDGVLQKLMRDFENQDKLELELKKKKAAKKDETGEFEAIVRQKLLNLLESYGLTKLGAILPTEDETRAQNEAVDKEDILVALRDKRLAKIWRKSQFAGFSEAELDDLKTELLHQQKKIDEYNLLKHEVLSLDNIHENSIDRLKRSDEEEEHIQRKRLDLKHKHREMKDGFQFVEATAQKVQEESPDFGDPRVVDLWVQIRKGNFSEQELQGFKEELKHFERKLEKRKFLKTEMDNMKNEKVNADPGKVRVDKEEKMEKKIDQFDRKIKKTYSELKSRIAVHNEL